MIVSVVVDNGASNSVGVTSSAPAAAEEGIAGVNGDAAVTRVLGDGTSSSAVTHPDGSSAHATPSTHGRIASAKNQDVSMGSDGMGHQVTAAPAGVLNPSSG